MLPKEIIQRVLPFVNVGTVFFLAGAFLLKFVRRAGADKCVLWKKLLNGGAECLLRLTWIGAKLRCTLLGYPRCSCRSGFAEHFTRRIMSGTKLVSCYHLN